MVLAVSFPRTGLHQQFALLHLLEYGHHPGRLPFVQGLLDLDVFYLVILERLNDLGDEPLLEIVKLHRFVIC